MKQIFKVNSLVKFAFLLLTPVLFQYFAFGFIWHSIYWGVITCVLLIWAAFVLISPLLGRIGCGWFCFMGTTFDFVGRYSKYKTKWKRPKVWVRLLLPVPFFASAITFYFLNKEQGNTHNFEVILSFLKLNFDGHYKAVWLLDTFAAFVFSLFIDKRWMCKNLCVMGAMCAAGAHYSRLIPVVNTKKCTQCRKCEKECLVGLQIVDFVKNNYGLVTNSECILCGKCAEVCKSDAVKLKFVWNRKKYKNVDQNR